MRYCVDIVTLLKVVGIRLVCDLFEVESESS